MDELKAVSTLALVSQEAVTGKFAEWKELGLDLQAALAALDETKNDVSYEQLDCLGLDYNRGWLVASLTIKRPTGYLAACAGVAASSTSSFWADWEDTCKLEYVGTVKLNVHDIASIPADGLHYWVGLPVTAELAKHRGPCQKPKLARIRAVLSWNVAPSTIDPDAVPHWGNRLDAHVEIRPGRARQQPGRDRRHRRDQRQPDRRRGQRHDAAGRRLRRVGHPGRSVRHREPARRWHRIDAAVSVRRPGQRPGRRPRELRGQRLQVPADDPGGRVDDA